jgi:hypothetical protein
MFVGTTHVWAKIGTTWNLTVHLFSNSNSSVNITAQYYYFTRDYWWEGAKFLVLHPGDTHSEIYISHITTDYPVEPIFHISLLDSEGYAQGIYNLTLLHLGYSVDVGTGELYVPDISAWLDSSSSSSISFNTSPLLFDLFLLFPIVFFSRKILRK